MDSTSKAGREAAIFQVARCLLGAADVCGQRDWRLLSLEADVRGIEKGQVGVQLSLAGPQIVNAQHVLAKVDGVAAVLRPDEAPE